MAGKEDKGIRYGTGAQRTKFFFLFLKYFLELLDLIRR